MSGRAKTPLVAIDSNILVWGVRNDGDRDKRKRAGWLFQALGDASAQIIVPSVAAAEFLSPIEPSQHKATLATIALRFIIAPFDAECASLAAVLFEHGKAARVRGTPGVRRVLRADSLIVATAKVAGAAAFFSHDGDCRKLAARAGLRAEDLPTMPNSLFEG